MALLDQLNGAVNLMHVVGAPLSAQPGVPISLSLAPPLGTVSITDFVDKPVNLDLIAKDVVFSNTNFQQAGWVSDPNIQKVMPLFNLATVPPTIDGSGVPGLVGKLTGTIPVAVPADVIPTMTIAWQVTDDNGNVLVTGTDFLAPNGLAQPNLDIVFFPAFVPFTGTIPPPAGRNVTATVALAAGGQQVTRALPPVRIEIPAIPFPVVLALTLHTNFQGAALVVVPGDSGVSGIDHLRALLQPIKNLLGTLTSIASLAEMLVGIDTVTGILNAANIEFRRTSEINNLNDITLIQRAWWQNDTEAEDELSAFAYLAPPPDGRRTNSVEMCNDRDLDDGQGRFVVTTGPAFTALCASLHSDAPTTSSMGANINVTHGPSGWWVDGFGDELSSIRFLT